MTLGEIAVVRALRPDVWQNTLDALAADAIAGAVTR
jgi:hypothetical protein